MTIPGGIRVKLSLALLVIVGSALLAAYAIIVPSLERRLVEAKLDQQESDAEILAINFATQVAQNNLSLGDFVDGAGFVSNSRVVLFGVGGTPEKRTLLSLADSSAVGGSEMETDPTALAAATTVRHRPRPRPARRARVRGGRRAAAHRRRRDAADELALRPARDGRARQAAAALRHARGAADLRRPRLRGRGRSMPAGSAVCSGRPT